MSQLVSTFFTAPTTLLSSSTPSKKKKLHSLYRMKFSLHFVMWPLENPDTDNIHSPPNFYE